MAITLAGRAGTIAQCRALADARAWSVAPLIEKICETGVKSFAEIARKMNERGSTTPQGKSWNGVQVRRVLARLKGL